MAESEGERLAVVVQELLGELGAEQVVTDRQRRRTYESDGLAAYRVLPGVVVLARDVRDVVATVRACARHGVPFVARGSGTGLSGGALPHADGVLLVVSQLRTVREVDAANQRAVVDPGVINLHLTAATSPDGYYFAPDPSSQSVCSIGGNVAENSGGAHCLKYGFTTNHVTGLDLVTPAGEQVEIGGKAPDPPGYDLLGALVGSEGTLGVVTSATVRLTRLPQEVRTLLAAFRTMDDAGAATSAIIATGVVPAAIEMMDALAIRAAEKAVRCGYPDGAGAVLVIELDGPAADVAGEFDDVVRLCEAAGAFEVRVAADDAERALIWKGRKSAFAAVGRISPDYIVQDGVIPRTALPQVLRRIAELSERAGVQVANVFHAGDGNLHPLVLFDGAVPGAVDRAEEVAGGILDLCLEHGGSITGEHGVGADKAKHMLRMFTAADLDTMQALRCAFDPEGIANPGKVFPTPRLCGDVPGRRRGAHPLSEAGVAEVF
ncbi:FAD-linked oxidase C-terminal domain-containing protein [Promicromonospora citrea]|uniref:FAD-binding protein n=1 Tax=Promicromonospora citrea TaxID=43677 RepID=A0A8H9L6F3_9MICO|nr:FAD-linked oxidase C-terminal domain-containing protein [Promicromonospora citrea]NNH54949.1 FAD-binding protein [Promicromonospora citrea]GGM42991.1 FAD-binding protein [Promicromonospora citrea]